MGLRFLGFLCLSFLTIACRVAEDSGETQEEVEDVIDEPEPSKPDADQPPHQKEKPSSSFDEGFDPCPSDTYFFELADGTVMTFEIEVFCDPRPFIDMGCPGPGL